MNPASILAAIAVTWFGGAYDSSCALGRVDRSRTSSETCLACHDGTAGPAISLHDFMDASHPIGISYAAARENMSVRRFGPTDSQIVLPRGRVECVSCHALDGTGPHWTLKPSGNLCTACHDK